MGNNTSSRNVTEKGILTSAELKSVSLSFKYLSRSSGKIKDEDLLKVWSTQIDQKLVRYMCNYFFITRDIRHHYIEFDKYAELFVYTVRGTTDERVTVFFKCFGREDEEGEIPYQFVKEYTEAIVFSYIKVLQLQNSRGYYSWVGHGFNMYKECMLRMAESLAVTICRPRDGIRQRDISKWFNYSPSLIKMITHIFSHLYKFTGKSLEKSLPKDDLRVRIMTPSERGSSISIHGTGRAASTDMIPLCIGLQYVPDFPCFIDIVQILFISSNLPFQCQKEWRFLFSSQIHGDSFNTLLGRIIEQGPCVIIIEDTDGYIFGGFGAESWIVGPKYFGNDNCFLFTLAPKMRIFSATGYNDHYQYLNIFQQTMPNGLGMGGQMNFWGLWLSSEYGTGQSCESCTTFKEYKQLSKQKDFKIKNIEVWGVEEIPLTEEELGRRALQTDKKSVLAGNAVNKALLELAGRPQHSEGLRDQAKHMENQLGSEFETKRRRASSSGLSRKKSLDFPRGKRDESDEET